MAPVVLAAGASNVRLHSVSARAVVPSVPSAAPVPAPTPTPAVRDRTTRLAAHASEPAKVASFATSLSSVVTAAAWHPAEVLHTAALPPGMDDVCNDVATSVPQLSPSSEQPSGPPSHASCSTLQKDQNSVTIKGDTRVKDAAGAIVKVLDRLCSTIVSALQEEPGHEALNRACKALAVCRKYLTDCQPGLELSFLPVNRTDDWGQQDPTRFSFLAFKSRLAPGVQLATGGGAKHQASLHVSSSTDPGTLAATLVASLVRQGQVVMKAGGGTALFSAMTAVIQARSVLKTQYSMDMLLVPQWITEDTRAALGRESKFLQFNLLPAGLHGVGPGRDDSPQAPAILPVPAAP